MKRIVSIISCICLLALFISLFFPLPGKNEKAPFDENTEGIVDVILRSKEDGSFSYRAIGPGQASMETAPFRREPLRIFRKTSHYPSSVKDGKIVNLLTNTHIVDESGNTVKITPELRRILELAAEIDHSILQLYILQLDGELFAAVELNVNLWLPCVLYHYDVEKDALVELYTTDSKDYIGLRIRNRDNLYAAS